MVDGPRAIVRLLAQAAFVPGEAVSAQVFEGDELLTTFVIPALDDERVVRLAAPTLRRGTGEASFRLEIVAGEPGPQAERVRPPWKLFDTYEIPRLSEMEAVRGGGGIDVAGSLAITAVTAPLLGMAVLRFDSAATLPANRQTKVHRARELPALTAGLLPGTAFPVDTVAMETIWKRGQPVPDAPPIVPIVRAHEAPKAAMRWCRSCGFEGPEAEHARATRCPRCDEPWF